MADPKMDAKAFEVGFCIAQCINQFSNVAFLSDETIADKTQLSRPSIIRARHKLKGRNWITWERTGGANHYRLSNTNVEAVGDFQRVLKGERDAQRAMRKRLKETENVGA